MLLSMTAPAARFSISGPERPIRSMRSSVAAAGSPAEQKPYRRSASPGRTRSPRLAWTRRRRAGSWVGLRSFAGARPAVGYREHAIMQSLDIVCPVFREEEMIELFHRHLTAALRPLDQRYRILHHLCARSVAGQDRGCCCVRLAPTMPRVEVIVMSRRFGHQAALIAGIDCSRGDAVVMLDSDMQHPPELIAQMVERWRTAPTSCRWCARTAARPASSNA